MNFDELSPELQKRAQTCKTPEELLNLAREEVTSCRTMNSSRFRAA